MRIRVEPTGYGAAALTTLRRVVAAAQADDPLAPVTVLVPNNIAGLVVRRHLAHGHSDGRPGVTGLFVATLARLAEQLAATRLHPRTPATAMVVASAWRSELDRNPGIFASVKDHPSSIRALVAAHTELRDLSEPALDSIATASPLHAGLIDLHRTTTARLRRSWYDQTDLMHAAADLLEQPIRTEQPDRTEPDETRQKNGTPHQTATRAGSDPTGHLGLLVLYLPEPLTRAATRLTASLAARRELTVLAGMTGDDRADAAIKLTLHRLGVDPPELPDPESARRVPPELPEVPRNVHTAQRVVHASDSDDEVRFIVREVIAALGSVPAHRIAVLHTRQVPYARLLHEQLKAAKLTINGPGTRTVAERSIARGWLGLLALPPDLPRVAFFRALAEAPARMETGDRVPVSRWERVSRLAGVVGGDDWAERLGRLIKSERSTIDEQLAADVPSRGQIANAERQIEAAQDLLAFVAELRHRLDQAGSQSTWAAMGDWALNLFHDLYGGEAELGTLPAEEQYAAGAIERALRGLATLDSLAVAVSPERLLDLLLLDLESALPRVGRFGEGIFVGPVAAAVGLDADLVIVAGLAEDAYPGRRSEEALLGTEIRERTDELRGPTDRLDSQLRGLLAAFAAAPAVIATFPRGDLRRSTQRLPSRWLLPTLRVLGGRDQLVAVDWEEVHGAGLAAVHSHAAELLTTTALATEQEWRIRAVSAGETFVDPVITAADLMVQARAAAEFTRYDGNLAGVEGLPDYANSGRAVSPTALESYAECPHSFFIKRLLGVEPLEVPEDRIVISPLDIGNLIHQSMDEFITECAATLPSYGEPWNSLHRSRLREIFAATANEFQARGATGHPLLWDRERAVMLNDVDTMLTDDNVWRAQHDARVVASELTFGRPGQPPVAVEVPQGRVLMMGSADKVDQTRDGVLLVTDIKTGSKKRYAGIETDTFVSGTKLQLPIYAHAARQILGGTGVRGQYWFVRKDRGERIEVTLNADIEARYAQTVGVLVAGVAAGYFPAKAPDGPDFAWVHCSYCNPDGLGHALVRDRWERKRFDPLLAELIALIDPGALPPEPEPEPEPGSEPQPDPQPLRRVPGTG